MNEKPKITDNYNLFGNEEKRLEKVKVLLIYPPVRLTQQPLYGSKYLILHGRLPGRIFKSGGTDDIHIRNEALDLLEKWNVESNRLG